MAMGRRRLLLPCLAALHLCLLAWPLPTLADEVVAADSSRVAAEAAEGEAQAAASAAAGSADGAVAEEAPKASPTETEQLISKLTIGMVSEVLDERTVVVQKSGRKLLRLGNVALPDLSSLGEPESEEKLKAARTALEGMLNKQMIWFKAAADEHQTKDSVEGDPVVLADIWTIDGRHINSWMKKQRHLVAVEEYVEELARDILSAEAEAQKKEQYKLLEEALRETAKAAGIEETAAGRKGGKKAAGTGKAGQQGGDESLGFTGLVGIAVLASAVLGGVYYGRPNKKRVNPPTPKCSKKGPLERFWSKLKGA